MYCVRILFFVSTLFACSSAKWNKVVETFDNAKIVPDLIENSPLRKADVIFVKSSQVVNLGNVLKPSEVQNAPTVIYSVGNHKEYYTLAFLDPDAPSRENPFERAFVHWLVGNIPQTNIGMGDSLAAFIGSAPPPNSGEHRYTFLVYKQSCKIEFNETILTKTDFEERKHFSMKEFAKKYKLGDPFAGNFYIALPEN